ncbi:MAG: hypothetical protein IKQ39_07450 [Oscillospiraceae bacterium]|nr:hypothetical protein [Oscillospiraceae bacterium]
MICPCCGEPIRSRHSFCVVCHADFTVMKPETTVRHAGEKLREVLTTPVSQLGKPQTASADDSNTTDQAAVSTERMHLFPT